MKLIFCPKCSDVVKLIIGRRRTCECGKSSGLYSDDLYATYSGAAVPLGFSNPSLVRALKSQPQAGLGQDFVAFVIAKSCSTFEYRPCADSRPVLELKVEDDNV